MISAPARSRGAFIVASLFKYCRIEDERDAQKSACCCELCRSSLNPLGGSVTRPTVWSSRISGAASTKPA